MLIKIPVAWLQARCAGFVWKPHQNKAQVPYHLAVVAGHLAVANTQAEKISRPLWESYHRDRRCAKIYFADRECDSRSRLYEDDIINRRTECTEQ